MAGEGRADDGGRMIAGRYRTVAMLGRGGMGTVWRAVDETLGRQVAVKELHPPAGADAAAALAGLQRRMQREARAAARINHPGVVSVHDVTEHEGHPVIVMELVEGESLADVMRRDGVLDPLDAAGIGARVSEALAAAHEVGVLHRDVKPGNILLEKGGRVVLTDFGIAAIDDAGDADTLTGHGELVGSLDYLAPERARGTQPGPPSDLWSLGATLYAAVEGGTPFRSSSTWSTITAIVVQPLPEPRRAGPLAPVLHALMAKDPGSRPDATQAARLLAAVAAAEPLPTDATGTVRLGRPAPPAYASEAPSPPIPAGSFGPPPAAPDQDTAPAVTPRATHTSGVSPAGPRPRRRGPAIAAAAAAVLVVGGGVTYLAVDNGADANAGAPADATPTQSGGPSSQDPGGASSKRLSSPSADGGKGKKGAGGTAASRSAEPADNHSPTAGSSPTASNAPAPEPSAADSGDEFVNTKSGKCLSLDGTANGTPVVQRTCSGGAEQQWRWAGSGTLRHVTSGKCLSVDDGGSTADGARAVLWTCITDWDAPEQRWTRTSSGQMKNSKSSKCLSIADGGSTADGAGAIQWSCITDWDAPEQRWKQTT
ncbi:protein kinase [Streptomyces sp. NPDC051940]|uniref:serine/threonine protein kinase n=1 Tax=Streptomyces sp. NPDC051940 TaxID=3155675 RepID=UPI003437102E